MSNSFDGIESSTTACCLDETVSIVTVGESSAFSVVASGSLSTPDTPLSCS